MKKSLIVLSVLISVFIFSPGVEAAVLNEQIDFNVDSYYDVSGRSQVTATLRVIGDHIYFYVEDNYWNNLSGLYKNAVREELELLAKEFDEVIYPKERAVFGSEWNPGIDNDSRITVLVTELINSAGGYINIYDEHPKSQIASSNEREMIYLNAIVILHEQNKSYLAHEFQHLITFYQKTVLYGIEEDVWLNEARSEYAPTVCGYNNDYRGSYLADRVDVFLDDPENPLGEWRNKTNDYGASALFMHYLANHYGKEIITKMVLSNNIGIASIDDALASLGYNKTFADVFADWAIASYLNDCSLGENNQYCYLGDLTYQRLNVDYSASYSGFPNLIVSRSSSVKDWSPQWYRFRQGTAQATEKDTLKLEFVASGLNSSFKVPYIIEQDNKKTINFMSLDNYQQGIAYIPNFTSLNKSVIMIPFNTYKKNNFTGNDPSSYFSFTASSISDIILPVINSISPENGSTKGGFEIAINGLNLSEIKKVIFNGKEITNFEIKSSQKITFIAPAASAGTADISIFDSENNEAVLKNAFTYFDESDYPEGSLLRAIGDYKVYIIKGSYKRWIQTAEIYNHYGHLTWDDIIDVDASVLDQYQEAWLIRADGDTKVYELNADATKHWLDMTAEEFSLTGRKWDMVYIVNNWERDFYNIGANVMYK